MTITFGQAVRQAYGERRIGNLNLLDANLDDEQTEASVVFGRIADGAIAQIQALESRAELAANPSVGEHIVSTLGWLKVLSPEDAARVTAAMQQFVERG